MTIPNESKAFQKPWSTYYGDKTQENNNDMPQPDTLKEYWSEIWGTTSKWYYEDKYKNKVTVESKFRGNHESLRENA